MAARSSAGSEVKRTPHDSSFGNVLKVVVIGDVNVGKTSLTLRYTNDEFRHNLLNTVGVDLKVKEVDMDGQRYTVRIWDTAGQERYKSIRGTFFRGASGAILVYDITNQQSFSSIPRWLHDLEESASTEDAPVLLFVGNKSDRASERKVSRLKAEETALNYKVKYSEVSAKTGDGVEKALDNFVADLIKASNNRSARKLSKDHTAHPLVDPSEGQERGGACRNCR